jgi:two-component system response regulator NreC
MLAQRLLVDYVGRAESGSTQNYNRLSGREREVLQLIADGRTNREIAETLSLSVRTVERFRASIMNKLGLHSRTELVNYAVRQGILSEGKTQRDPKVSLTP